MELKYNRKKDELINVMKSKGDKKGIVIRSYANKLEISLDYETYKDESIIPVTFKSTFEEEVTNSKNASAESERCTLKGRFVYGFYLYTMVILAMALIIARFTSSYIQKQVDNMILCGIVTVVLVIVVYVVRIKSKPAKKIIIEFLNYLDKK